MLTPSCRYDFQVPHEPGMVTMLLSDDGNPYVAHRWPERCTAGDTPHRMSECAEFAPPMLTPTGEPMADETTQCGATKWGFRCQHLAGHDLWHNFADPPTGEPMADETDDGHLRALTYDLGITIYRLSSGYYHARGRGPCEWAQWPDDRLPEDGEFFPKASEDFRRTLRSLLEIEQPRWLVTAQRDAARLAKLEALCRGWPAGALVSPPSPGCAEWTVAVTDEYPPYSGDTLAECLDALPVVGSTDWSR